jgi:hypothetical protein
VAVTPGNCAKGSTWLQIVGFDFCGAVLVWHEHIQNTVVNAFHPHPKAKSVKFAGAYQGVQHCYNRKLLVPRGMHVGLLMRLTYADENDVDVKWFTRMYISRFRSIDSARDVPIILNHWLTY